MPKQTKPTEQKLVKRTKGRPSHGGKARVKFELPKDELISRGVRLSHLMQQVEVEEENAKAAAASARARIKDWRAQAKDLLMQVGNGYEEREVDVLIEFDKKNGCKHLFIHAPGQESHDRFVRTETMTEDDFNLLPIEETPAKPKAKGDEPLPNPVLPPDAAPPQEGGAA